MASRGPHHVVIVGGGFAGLYAAKHLVRDANVVLTLVDRRNFHLFQPLLYQVATGALSPGEIAQPLRSILRRHQRATVLLGEAVGLDAANRRLVLSDGGPIPYDTLIVATGAHHAYFGNEGWERFAPGLKTIEDAQEMRRRILIAFEAAEREADEELRRGWMTFVVVGGGPTGVELAGALGEIANDTLRQDFRSINPPDARIILVEAVDRVLPPYPPKLSRSAARQLERLGVTVWTKTKVISIDEHGVTVERESGEERVPARTVLWAAGVEASRFGRIVAAATGVETDRAGRIEVGPDLTIPGHPEIFVIGDLAVAQGPNGKPVPGVAPAAIQEGTYVAREIGRRLAGEASEAFRYRDKGDVATIGRLRGVANIGWLGPFGRLSGFPAWAMWLGIHIVYLIGFANRIVVTIRWAWSFFTRGRSTRLITGQGPALLPPIEEPEPPPAVDD
ncbi:MAG TPA: NAD(P)/FAD-dependent oxidoreductase [Clostridia bacterium]|nr:NAD(P)/FAD-dependent oxidoreductase [Clostridia bacterium]